MRTYCLALAAVTASLAACSVGPRPTPVGPIAAKTTPTDVIKASAATSWTAIPADQLLVLELANARRVVIQLAPQFAPVHVANIQALAQGRWWDGAAIYRVQDNYVVQWGNNDSDKPFPTAVVAKPPAEYEVKMAKSAITPLGHRDAYADRVGFVDGWPVGYDRASQTVSLTHCYGMVGVGRDLHPDTGTGGELYAVIGQAPRQLDRNIALVGRVIDGFDAMTALPRGPAPMGFYEDRARDLGIRTARLASDMPAAVRPAYEMMDVRSTDFARLIAVRANRSDDFYRRPAGGVDLCNVPVPVRPLSAKG